MDVNTGGDQVSVRLCVACTVLFIVGISKMYIGFEMILYESVKSNVY